MGNADFNTIPELLEGSKLEFQVPPYQRGYEWETEEWRDLWLDINRINQQVGTHFLGNVILLNKGNKTLEIVDGQQRITTISILLMAIRDSGNWEGDPKDARIDTLVNYRPSTERKRKLKLNDPDADESYESIWNNDLKQAEGEILDVYKYYTIKLKNFQHNEIEELLDKIVDNLRVVRTQLEDPALAYPIFQSQNARGKEVPPHILATSRVHGEAYKLDSETEERRVIKKWDGVYEDLEKNLGRPRYRPNHDIPIKRPIKHIISASNVETPTRIQDKQLYDNFERLINTYKNVSDFVEWFDNEKDTYLKVASSSDNISGGRLSPDTIRYLQYLNCAPSHSELLSYILYKNYDNEDLLREFFQLSSILTMRFELADADNRKQRAAIYSAASKIKDANTSGEVRKILKNKIREDTPEDEEIKLNLKGAHMNMSNWKFRTRLILVSIEESRKSTKSLNLSQLHIDHISPRNTFSKDEYYEWKMRHDQEEFSDRCKKIGNLALLTDSEHAQLKESSYSDKLKTYKNSDISTTRGITNLQSDWGDDAIDERTELMANELVNYWSLP